MTAANTTNKLPLLKRLWGTKVEEPLHKASKFFALMGKDTNFGGEGRYVVVSIAPTAGGSASFGEAVANQDAAIEKRFFVTHRKEYQVFSIQGDAIARMRGDKNAMVEGVKNEADKARYAFSRNMARRVWGNGGGSRGVISAASNVATATITLENTADVLGFDAGMWIQLADDDGSATSPLGTRDSGKKLQIATVNRRTGEITLVSGSVWSDIAGAATGDFIFRAGDYALAITGLRGWNPISDPSSGESFMNLDRSVADPQRLSGIRVSGGGGSKEETLNNAGAELQIMGAATADLFASPRDVASFANELGSKRQYIEVKTAHTGFRAFVCDTPIGEVRVFSEPDVPEGYAWLEDTSKVVMRTAGDCPMMLNEDGAGKLLRDYNDDAYQGRLGCYGNIFHENPGHGCVITW